MTTEGLQVHRTQGRIENVDNKSRVIDLSGFRAGVPLWSPRLLATKQVLLLETRELRHLCSPLGGRGFGVVRQAVAGALESPSGTAATTLAVCCLGVGQGRVAFILLEELSY